MRCDDGKGIRGKAGRRGLRGAFGNSGSGQRQRSVLEQDSGSCDAVFELCFQETVQGYASQRKILWDSRTQNGQEALSLSLKGEQGLTQQLLGKRLQSNKTKPSPKEQQYSKSSLLSPSSLVTASQGLKPNKSPRIEPCIMQAMKPSDTPRQREKEGSLLKSIFQIQMLTPN